MLSEHMKEHTHGSSGWSSWGGITLTQIEKILQQYPIQPEELDLYRKILKIGDDIWLDVDHLDMSGTKFFRTKRTKVRVIKKYPHVVVTRDMRTGKEHHTTYIELLMLERKAQYGDTAL